MMNCTANCGQRISGKEMWKLRGVALNKQMMQINGTKNASFVQTRGMQNHLSGKANGNGWVTNTEK